MDSRQSAWLRQMRQAHRRPWLRLPGQSVDSWRQAPMHGSRLQEASGVPGQQDLAACRWPNECGAQASPKCQQVGWQGHLLFPPSRSGAHGEPACQGGAGLAQTDKCTCCRSPISSAISMDSGHVLMYALHLKFVAGLCRSGSAGGSRQADDGGMAASSACSSSASATSLFTSRSNLPGPGLPPGVSPCPCCLTCNSLLSLLKVRHTRITSHVSVLSAVRFTWSLGPFVQAQF